MVCVYFVTGIGELALYLTIYCGTVDDKSGIYSFDIGCKGDNLASGFDG